MGEPPASRDPGAARLAGGALLLGAVTALAVWLFKRAVAVATAWWFDGAWSPAVGALLFVLVPTGGGLLVGLILHWARQPEEPGHGVTEVIEAVKLDVHEMPHASITVKAPVAALSLGSGASLGPEDPAVEIGGSIGAFAAKRWRWPHSRVQGMVAAGAAAGISAAFHAPLAAVLFATEVFGVRPVSRRMVWVALAAVAAFGTMRLVAPEAVFRIPDQEGLNGWLLATGLFLGVLAGVIGALLIRGMYKLQHVMLRWEAVPRWLKPALGGLALGGAGLFLPEVLGIGYPVIQSVVSGERLYAALLAALLVGKLVLMAVSFGTGFLGGFFAPSFFAGAALGALTGVLMAPLVPVEPTGAAVVGMAALLAAVVHAPLTAVLLLVAVSDDYSIVPVLLLASVVSYWVSTRLVDGSAYTFAFAHPARTPRGEGRTDR